MLLRSSRRLAPRRPLSLAIIGGGAGGIISAHAARRESGNNEQKTDAPLFWPIHLFEARSRAGGLWRTRDARLASARPTPPPVYRNLRANLPIRCMELPATSGFSNTEARIARTSKYPDFVDRSTITRYILELADELHHSKDVRCRWGTAVTGIEPDNDRFHLQICRNSETGTSGGLTTEESFDAVLVCTGHFHKPHVPADWAELQTAGKVKVSHSYDFDVVESRTELEGKRVAVVGTGPSARDIVEMLASPPHRQREGLGLSPSTVRSVDWLGRNLSNRYFAETGSGVGLGDPKYRGERLPLLRQIVDLHLGSSADELPKTSVPRDVEHVILGTGYTYEGLFDWISPELRPRVLSPANGNKLQRLHSTMYTHTPSTNVNEAPPSDRLAYIGLAPFGVLLPAMHWQATAFCRRHLFAATSSQGRPDLLTPKGSSESGPQTDFYSAGEEVRLRGLTDTLGAGLPLLTTSESEEIEAVADVRDRSEQRILHDFTTFRDFEYG